MAKCEKCGKETDELFEGCKDNLCEDCFVRNLELVHCERCDDEWDFDNLFYYQEEVLCMECAKERAKIEEEEE